MDWFLYGRDFRYERVKKAYENIYFMNPKNLRATISTSLFSKCSIDRTITMIYSAMVLQEDI